MDDPFVTCIWLYRGVPRESAEVADVMATNELWPPRPDRVGEEWRLRHIYGDTNTAYTSWSTDRSIATEAARFLSDTPGLSGEIVVFRVRLEAIQEDRIFLGRDDEFEFLIQGQIEDVSISDSEVDDEEAADDNRD